MMDRQSSGDTSQKGKKCENVKKITVILGITYTTPTTTTTTTTTTTNTNTNTTTTTTTTTTV